MLLARLFERCRGTRQHIDRTYAGFGQVLDGVKPDADIDFVSGYGRRQSWLTGLRSAQNPMGKPVRADRAGVGRENHEFVARKPRDRVRSATRQRDQLGQPFGRSDASDPRRNLGYVLGAKNEAGHGSAMTQRFAADFVEAPHEPAQIVQAGDIILQACLTKLVGRDFRPHVGPKAQQQLFPAENALAQTRFARLQTLVQLYRALGGGWEAQS